MHREARVSNVSQPYLQPPLSLSRAAYDDVDSLNPKLGVPGTRRPSQTPSAASSGPNIPRARVRRVSQTPNASSSVRQLRGYATLPSNALQQAAASASPNRVGRSSTVTSQSKYEMTSSKSTLPTKPVSTSFSEPATEQHAVTAAVGVSSDPVEELGSRSGASHRSSDVHSIGRAADTLDLFGSSKPPATPDKTP